MEHKILERYPLGNKRFAWKQKEFTLSTFSGVPMFDIGEGEPKIVAEKYVKALKEAGFTMIETGWVRHDYVWEAVEACEKYGLDMIFQDLSILGGMQQHNAGRTVTEETVRDLVSELKKKKHVIGYYVWDEPSAEEHYAEARRQMDLLEKYHPEALLFTVALPDYNLAGEDGTGYNWENGLYAPYVERFIQRMDPPVLSFDYYPIGDYFNAWCGRKFNRENQLDDTYMWLDMGLFRKLADYHKLPFWFYYQSYTLYKTTEYFTFPMIRCFMYGAILYGAKGLQGYAAGGRNNLLLTAGGEKYGFYEDQKQIHSEITALGNTLMALDSKLVYHSEDLLPGDQFIKSYVECIEDSEIFAGKLPKRTSVGELEDAYGNRYVVILNRDYETVLKASIEMQDDFRVYEVSKADGTQSVMHESVRTLPIQLEPGDAVLLRVQKACEPAFTVEYQLV